MPTIDEALGRLKRAGGSVGHAAFGSTWRVDGTNGENVLIARGATLEEAYHLACVQARAVGMLAPAGRTGAVDDAPRGGGCARRCGWP
jgi:hypothetical protein